MLLTSFTVLGSGKSAKNIMQGDIWKLDQDQIHIYPQNKQTQNS